MHVLPPISVFTPRGSIFMDTVRVVLHDLKWFLAFLGLVMLGFAFAFFCLFRLDREDAQDFRSLWHSVASMFAYM